MIGDFLKYIESWKNEVLPLDPIDVCVATPTLFFTRIAVAWLMSMSNAMQHLGVTEVVVCKLLCLAQRAEHHLVTLFRQLISYQ